MPLRQFPPPWSVEESYGCFTVLDPNGQRLAHIYFENDGGRRAAGKPLNYEEARRIADDFAKLPMVPRQILKEIPRPPDSASGDD